MTGCHSCQLSITDLLYKNFQKEQLNSVRFPVFSEGVSNSSRFPVFPDFQALDYITTNIPPRSSLRASSNSDLFQPRTERRIGDRAFSVATPRAWNRLPTELKLMWSLTATFKRHLKSFLFRTAYTDYVMHLRADCIEGSLQILL